SYNFRTFVRLIELRPIVATGDASGIAPTAASVNGTVNPNEAPTTYHFEYGTTSAYGTKTADSSVGAGSTPQPVPAALPGLAPTTTYHYRLVGTNAYGTVAGGDKSFTTTAQPPPPPP